MQLCCRVRRHRGLQVTGDGNGDNAQKHGAQMVVNASRVLRHDRNGDCIGAGKSKAAVEAILHRALEKIRKHPELCARFRKAVEENRRALDRRWMSRPQMERIQ